MKTYLFYWKAYKNTCTMISLDTTNYKLVLDSSI